MPLFHSLKIKSKLNIWLLKYIHGPRYILIYLLIQSNWEWITFFSSLRIFRHPLFMQVSLKALLLYYYSIICIMLFTLFWKGMNGLEGRENGQKRKLAERESHWGKSGTLIFSSRLKLLYMFQLLITIICECHC